MGQAPKHLLSIHQTSVLNRRSTCDNDSSESRAVEAVETGEFGYVVGGGFEREEKWDFFSEFGEYVLQGMVGRAKG